MVGGCQFQAKNSGSDMQWQLVYENNFNKDKGASDWVMEGPGEFEIGHGKMTMWPLAQKAMLAKWESAGRKTLDPKTEYYQTIEKALKAQAYPKLETLYNDKGTLNGGHIVLWNKKIKTQDDYAVEFDFKPLSPIGLAILFFSGNGGNGEDLFDPTLKDRHGVFGSYIRGDINCYHISYWANNAAVGKRGSCNLRKNHGFYNLANESDPSVAQLDYTQPKFTFTTHHIRLEKVANTITFYINGQQVISYKDKQFNDTLGDNGGVQEANVDTGSYLKGGRIGLRQMTGLKAEYSNFKVYQLKK